MGERNTGIWVANPWFHSRRCRRQAVSELKKRRRVEVGPFATFYFENYETMWHQVHEMLYIERGGGSLCTGHRQLSVPGQCGPE